MIHYEFIHDDELEYQLYKRYQREIMQLEDFGFHEIHYVREVVFPFSALVLFWMYPKLVQNREMFRIEAPLRYVLLMPMLINRQYDTFAHFSGWGTKFSTLFTDDTMMITANHETKTIIKPKRKIYRYARPNETIPEVWNRHEHHIQSLKIIGRKTDSDLSLDHFEYLMLRDTKAMLFGH